MRHTDRQTDGDRGTDRRRQGDSRRMGRRKRCKGRENIDSGKERRGIPNSLSHKDTKRDLKHVRK